MIFSLRVLKMFAISSTTLTPSWRVTGDEKLPSCPLFLVFSIYKALFCIASLVSSSNSSLSVI
ncbi:hypothetical protein [Campylobacter pinnipediorum]|uniref:hypothetical protein n=1 Tax=Campylobacter pinnipediorum TaxID=1965231 RepID=UPI00138FA3A6|nr:hypothetical protein [Campylobacter pinnipediorum]